MHGRSTMVCCQGLQRQLTTVAHTWEGTVALKHGLVARGILEHATLRSSLLPLEFGTEEEIHAAFSHG
jgi:hypothetical protein